MNLTPHFTLEELTFSGEGARRGLKNVPTEAQIQNLTILANGLESVRTLLGNHPIHINSAFRSLEVNNAVGGSLTSQHMQGLAADIVCRGFGNPYLVCVAIRDSGLEFDQLILEFNSWTHISFPAPGKDARKDLLTKKAGVAGYLRGLVI